MNSKLVGAGIGVSVILVLIFIVFGIKAGHMTEASPELKSVKALISEGKLDEASKELGELAEKDKSPGGFGKLYFDLAKSYEGKGSLVKARDAYEIILMKYQNVDNILDVQESAGRLNIKIIFSPVITNRDALYQIEPGDTLLNIAKKFGTTVDLIKASNSLKSDVIQAGSKLKVSKAGYKILVDKTQNLLTVFFDDIMIMKVYRVSTGENNCTPTGTFKIVNKIKDPVWFTEGAIVPAESPDNILGSRWMGLSEEGYGIHGTVDPKTVGQQVTAGCVRMFNADVEELYTIVPVGTEVTIVD